MTFQTCVNSWGQDWGESGTFKIIRAENECSIEDFVIAALVHFRWYADVYFPPEVPNWVYDYEGEHGPSAISGPDYGGTRGIGLNLYGDMLRQRRKGRRRG